jgi:uncharacterized protein (TIGR02996 family)
MQKHPDADAFIRAYLEQPADTVSRLVFADWLEETGVRHNSAWARFIRLTIEADQHPADSTERRVLERRADSHAPSIRAKLTVSARQFVDYPKALLQLLPAPNITVRLANFTVPPPVYDLMNESVAREKLTFPLDLQERTLFVATVDPRNADTAVKLSFILNRDIILVCAEPDDVQEAINRHYGQTETESVDEMLVEFVDTTIDVTRGVEYSEPEPTDAPVVRLVNLILGEATNLRADCVWISPKPGGVLVLYRIDDTWVERDSPPRRLLGPIMARLAILAGIPVEWTFPIPPLFTPMSGECVVNLHAGRFRVRITIQPSPDGPSTRIDLSREPATAQ